MEPQEELFAPSAEPVEFVLESEETPPVEPVSVEQAAPSLSAYGLQVAQAAERDPEGFAAFLAGRAASSAPVAPAPSAVAADPYADPELVNKLLENPGEVLRQVEARARAQAIAELQPTFHASANVSAVRASLAGVGQAEFGELWTELGASVEPMLAQLQRENPSVFSNPQAAQALVQNALRAQAWELQKRRSSVPPKPRAPLAAVPGQAVPGATQARTQARQVRVTPAQAARADMYAAQFGGSRADWLPEVLASEGVVN